MPNSRLRGAVVATSLLLCLGACSTTLLDGDVDAANVSAQTDGFAEAPDAAPHDAGRIDNPEDMRTPGLPDAPSGPADVGADMTTVPDQSIDMPPDMAAPPPIPVCANQCATPADCTGTLMGGLFDEENYECDMGACRWLGCISDAECDGINPGSECKQGAFGFNSCLSTCSVATDCAQAGMGPFDADNYECVQGSCEYRGCNNDAECQTLGANYRCSMTTSPNPTCQLTCQTPSDCSTATGGAYDADNYACNGNQCEYLGCASDAECQETNPNFICR